jgi:hypothetical protein
VVSGAFGGNEGQNAAAFPVSVFLVAKLFDFQVALAHYLMEIFLLGLHGPLHKGFLYFFGGEL